MLTNGHFQSGYGRDGSVSPGMGLNGDISKDGPPHSPSYGYGTGGSNRYGTGGSDRYGTGGSDRYGTGGSDRYGTGGSDRYGTGGSDRYGPAGTDRYVGGPQGHSTGGSDRFGPPSYSSGYGPGGPVSPGYGGPQSPGPDGRNPDKVTTINVTVRANQPPKVSTMFNSHQQ